MTLFFARQSSVMSSTVIVVTASERWFENFFSFFTSVYLVHKL